MEKNNKNIEELSSIELMKEIYKEIVEMKQAINKTEKKVDKLSDEVDEMSDKLDELTDKVEEHDKRFESLGNKTDKLSENFESLEQKTDKISKSLDDLSRTEKLHFEYTSNKFNRLEQKIDSNFKYLDEKIDNTKNKLVSETSDILESFSIAATKSIKNIENKINNEKNERVSQIDQIRGMNDYNKIILRNLESRICILEEESEKYKLRCFLLKLGAISDEFKTLRLFWLERFNNQSSAWRRGQRM